MLAKHVHHEASIWFANIMSDGEVFTNRLLSNQMLRKSEQIKIAFVQSFLLSYTNYILLIFRISLSS